MKMCIKLRWQAVCLWYNVYKPHYLRITAMVMGPMGYFLFALSVIEVGDK